MNNIQPLNDEQNDKLFIPKLKRIPEQPTLPTLALQYANVKINFDDRVESTGQKNQKVLENGDIIIEHNMTTTAYYPPVESQLHPHYNQGLFAIPKERQIDLALPLIALEYGTREIEVEFQDENKN